MIIRLQQEAAVSGYRSPTPSRCRQADAVASDRCRPPRAGRLGRRQQLDGRIAQGGLDQWRGRAFAGDVRSDRFEKSGSGGRHAAADDDPLDAEGQGERSDRSRQVVGHAVGDLERDLVARGAGAEDVGGTRMGRQDGAATGSHRLVGLATDRRTGGDRLEAAAQPAGADDARPGRRRRDRPRRQSRCRRGAATPSRTTPAEMPVPIARKATLAGACADPFAGLLAEPQRRRAGVVLDERSVLRAPPAASVPAAGG